MDAELERPGVLAIEAGWVGLGQCEQRGHRRGREHPNGGVAGGLGSVMAFGAGQCKPKLRPAGQVRKAAQRRVLRNAGNGRLTGS